ncbi:AarF/ABC1/UbiB kinase family protein [Kaustia mangrovi]|uniref:AarF/ABC1/UbiB kinase family protein n=1 Tax=Kaustia mangrovi TaxID=2593653 RepID=A0A7S8C2I0_9HYPH|nr:AarF/UbiB family protein [Kaustia mangrovi]QPC42168.1 AarF/ABC1/UbiB kinase family protein [Kaustia mangrovi]
MTDERTPPERDREGNRLTGRVRRYARVGTGMGTVAARLASGRILGGGTREEDAKALRAALGDLKGPLMKVAQLLATIPDALPPEYAMELTQLQSHAPPMGWPFVRRRMAAELGADWRKKVQDFEREAAAAASLGQVHRAWALDGSELACKLQYPEMQSAVEADLSQLQWIFAIHRRMDPAIDTSEIHQEIGERLREELDYDRERRHIALYGEMLKDVSTIRVPKVYPELSTRRLLTMSWLEGRSLLDFREADLDARNLLATSLFKAWWLPFCRHGVIHGDPHLGNYSAMLDGEGRPCGLNLLDYGCIRIFPPRFVGGVVELYHGLREDDRDRIVSAYETWGFKGLSNELIDILNIWARFIYGPLMEDRVRKIAEGVSPGQYGRHQAFTVHRALKEKGPVRVPREFVFMDRAAIGLGGVLIHLKAELNFYRLFNEAIEDFSVDAVAARQTDALKAAGLA